MADAYGSGPLVSIVIPVYNGSNFLACAIDSALAQTWPNVEVVVIDDGSDDDGATAAICAGYGARIRYFHKSNGGVASAINYGLQVMRGEFFSWLSHDDAYTPGRIANMLAAHAERVGAGDGRPLVLFSEARRIDADGQPVARRSSPYLMGRSGFGAIVGRSINGCTLLVPRRCFGLAGLLHPGLPTTQDNDMWQRLLAVSRIEHVAEQNVLSRAHPGQESHSPWHLIEAGLNGLALLDRLDYGELAEPGESAPRSLRKMVDSGAVRKRWRALPGETLHRLGRSIARQSVTLVRVGPQALKNRGPTIPECRVSADAAAVVEQCRSLGSDLVWLVERMPAQSGQVLAQMLDCLARHPLRVGCLRASARVRKGSVLGAFDGALLPTAVFRDLAMTEEPWQALAHQLMRAGGLQMLRGEDDPATGAVRRANRLRACLAARPRRLTGLRACGLQPRLWLGLRLRAWYARVAERRLHVGNAELFTRPTMAQRLFAWVARRERLAAWLNRAVLALSASREGGRLRLLRLHGIAGHFATAWYRQVCPQAEGDDAQVLLHYLSRGWRRGEDPSPGFDTRGYLADHPDVAARGLHPLQHYALVGRFEGRRVRRSSRRLPEPASGAVLLLVPPQRRDARRIGLRLQRQLGRGLTVVLLECGEDGLCRPVDEGGDASAQKTFPLGDVASEFEAQPAVRIVVIGMDPLATTCTAVAAQLGCALDRVVLDLGEADKPGDCVARYYVFSSDVEAVLRQARPDAAIVRVACPDPGRQGMLRPWVRYRDPAECRRIAVFGKLTEKDGREALLAVLARVRRHALPCVFTVFGEVEGGIPKFFRAQVEVVAPGDERELSDAVMSFNPDLAWVPQRRPAAALPALIDATSCALPLIAFDSPDAREWLAGRALTWLTRRCGDAGAMLYLFAHAVPAHGPADWMPTDPLEGFGEQGRTLSRRIRASLAGEG